MKCRKLLAQLAKYHTYSRNGFWHLLALFPDKYFCIETTRRHIRNIDEKYWFFLLAFLGRTYLAVVVPICFALSQWNMSEWEARAPPLSLSCPYAGCSNGIYFYCAEWNKFYCMIINVYGARIKDKKPRYTAHTDRLYLVNSMWPVS